MTSVTGMGDPVAGVRGTGDSLDGHNGDERIIADSLENNQPTDHARNDEVRQHEGDHNPPLVSGSGLLAYFVKIQSLLLQLSRNQVRGDFVDGFVMAADDLDLLLFCLDKMKQMLIPAGGFMKPGGVQSERVMKHVQALYSSSQEVFCLPVGELDVTQLTYARWNRVLLKLCGSKYWDNFVPVAEGEVKVVTTDYIQKPVKREQEDSDESSGSGLQQKSPTNNIKIKVQPRHKRQDSVPIEEIVIDSSDSSEDEDDVPSMTDGSGG